MDLQREVLLDPLVFLARKDGTTEISPSLGSESKDSEGGLDLLRS